MDPNLIRELLEGQEDIITPEVEAEAALYRNTTCPMCGSGECQKRIKAPRVVLGEDGAPELVSSPFSSGVLPEGYAHCIHCGTNFNPYTGMIYGTEASMIHGSE